MQRFNFSLLVAALAACLCAGAAYAQAPAGASAEPGEPAVTDYGVDVCVRVLTDRRTGGVSDTLNQPGAELHVEAAHASGWLALVELDSVSKHLFPGGDGAMLMLAGGYRWGDPDAWHFGLGVAHENFLGAKVTGAPTGFDSGFAPTGVRDFDFNTSYGVFEFGYGAVEARYLQVVSEDFRGVNTASICGTLLQTVADPAVGLGCYARGNVDSRGTQLLDVDYKHPLNGRTALTLHGGLKRIKNFSEVDMTDWRVGVQHKRWGVQWAAELMGTDTRTAELYQGTDGSGNTRQIDGSALVLSAAYTF